MLSFFYFYVGSFSYTSHADFVFMWGVSLTHPVLPSFLSKGVSLTHPVLSSFFCLFLFCFLFVLFLSGEFLLHIPCWLHFYIGSFSYTSHAAFLKIIFGSFSYTSRAGFIFTWVVPLKHPVRPSFLCGEFLLHIPCCLFILFYFIFIFREFLLHIHPVPASFSSGFFLLNILWCLHFYVGSFSYTSHADFLFLFSGVSLTHPVLASFLSGELHAPC